MRGALGVDNGKTLEPPAFLLSQFVAQVLLLIVQRGFTITHLAANDVPIGKALDDVHTYLDVAVHDFSGLLGHFQQAVAGFCFQRFLGTFLTRIGKQQATNQDDQAKQEGHPGL